jgi:UDP-N-acetylmuramoyl-tripeptide--D-alanyl-D-alanine ligase
MLCSDTQTLAKLLDVIVSKNVDFKNLSFDTRKVVKGTIFVALKGTNFNGHHYIEQAEKLGAVGIIISEPVASKLPALLVANTQIALGVIAHWHLQNLKPTTIAITGSNGKTTCKNMLSNILNLQAPTLKTQGNLNNHLGVPMTLLNLEKKHRYAVIEMGANHLGEIAYLRKMVTPDVAIVINTLDAHIGEFGGFDNLVRAKGEIYTQFSKNIVNTKTQFSGNVSFGEGGDVFASNISGATFTLNIKQKTTTIRLQLLGIHNIENALAASACADALGVDIPTIKQGLESTQAEKSRLCVIQKSTQTIIDDSYNASPSSTQYALEVLAGFGGERVAILGVMGELDKFSAEAHKKIRIKAKSLGITNIYSFGIGAQAYGVQHFTEQQALLEQLKTHPNATLLFKGSRIAKLEQIIAKI